jgi:sugar phosphate permease
MTVVSAAVPVGGAIITPLLAIAVRTFGWRWAAFLAGALFLMAGVPLCVGIRRSPESIGMQPDGATPQRETNGNVHEETQTSRNEDPDVTAREAFRSPIFWNLICSMTARSLAFTTVTTHFIPMMVWKGLTQTEASVLLAGFAIFNLPIHFLLGWIADFVNKPKLVTICLLLGVIAVLPSCGPMRSGHSGSSLRSTQCSTRRFRFSGHRLATSSAASLSVRSAAT